MKKWILKRWVHGSVEATTYTLVKAPYFRDEKLTNWIGKQTKALSEAEALSNFRYRIVKNAGVDINRNRSAFNEVKFPEGSVKIRNDVNDLNHRSLLELELGREDIEAPEVSDEYTFEEDDLDE